MAYYQPFNTRPAIDALRRVGPKSTYPGWQVPTAISPSLSSWMHSPAASPEDTADRDPLTNLTNEPGGSPVPQDPTVVDYKNKQAMKSYLEDRMFGATRAGDPTEAAAISGLMGSNQSYLDENPITKQGIEGDTLREAEVKAIQAGFTGTSPQRVQGQPNAWRNEPVQQPIQQAASVGRGMEMFKANVPVEQQKIASKGQLDVAKTRADQLQGNVDFMQELARRGQLRSGNPNTGAFSLQNQPVEKNQVATKLLSDIMAARKARAGMSVFSTGKSAADDAIKKQIAMAMASYPADADTKAFMQMVLSKPNLSELKLADILIATDETELDQETINDLQNMLLIARGF